MYLNAQGSTTYERGVVGLTLTWDVFKYVEDNFASVECSCLTLTWDVFKFKVVNVLSFISSCLTLTWDVFKFIYINSITITITMFNFNMRCI